MSVGQICVRQVDLAEADDTVLEAAERMRQRAVGTLLILNQKREPIGIVTDRDLVERVVASNRDPATTSVRSVMTVDPETISEHDSIESALSMMRSGRFRRLPVVDHRGKLAGLVSLDDVLMLLGEELAQISKLLERETPPGVVAESLA